MKKERRPESPMLWYVIIKVVKVQKLPTAYRQIKEKDPS